MKMRSAVPVLLVLTCAELALADVPSSTDDKAKVASQSKKSLAKRVCSATPKRRLVVHGHQEKFYVPVTLQHRTTLAPVDKKGFRGMAVTKHVKGFHPTRSSPHLAVISLSKRARFGRTLTMVMDGRSTVDQTEYKALVTFVACRDALAASLSFSVLHESEDIALKAQQEAKRKAADQQREAELAEAREQGREEGRAEEKEASEKRRLAEESHRVIRETREVSRDKHVRLRALYSTRFEGENRPLGMLVSRWDSTGTKVLAQFRAHYEKPRPFHVTGVRVRARDPDAELEAMITAVDRPAANDSVIAIMEQGQTLTGVVALTPLANRPIETLPHRIELLDEQAGTSLSVSLRGWTSEYYSLQLTPEQEWKIREAKREAREARDVQLIIAPRLVGGVFWVPNGLEPGAGRKLDATYFGGAGVRTTKGISELFALEGDIVVGGTGMASFDGGTRSGYFGRVQLGVAFRLGHNQIPIARFGLGVLGARYDSETLTESKSEASGLLSVGIGYAKRFSEEWLLSASMSALTTGAQEMRIFEAGVQLGYGFTPGFEPSEVQ